MFLISLVKTALLIVFLAGYAQAEDNTVRLNSLQELKEVTDIYQKGESPKATTSMQPMSEVRGSHTINCCPCGQCVAGCKCGCGCDMNPDGEKVCFERFDAETSKAFFKAHDDDRRFEYPVTNPHMFRTKRPGECGRLTVQPQLMCTDFVPEGSKGKDSAQSK